LHAASEAPRRLARLTVSPQAAVANWKFFAERSAGETGAVVKADCYGLGADIIAPALAAAGAMTFFVATLGEALSLRALLGRAVTIYVFNGPAPGESATFAQAALIPVLNSPAQIALWDARLPHALHIDTGMNRLGLKAHELSAAEHLKPLIVMSHLACASDSAHPKNVAQRARFLEAAARFPDAKKSLAASGGVLLGRGYTFDMTRPGIGLYGGGAMDEANPSLSVVATLEAPILQVFDLPAGESVGYGATFASPFPLKAATVALGYADGWLRSLSGKGYGHIGGATCPLLGRVSMDLVTIDISAAPNARAGDLVEFLGANVKLDDVAARAGTISYEVLTNLSGVRRQT
jgi:alanine racemase